MGGQLILVLLVKERGIFLGDKRKMTNFVRVYDKNRNIVQLSVQHIVVMRPYGDDINLRMMIMDVLGNIYTSLQEPDDFREKIGAEK